MAAAAAVMGRRRQQPARAAAEPDRPPSLAERLRVLTVLEGELAQTGEDGRPAPEDVVAHLLDELPLPRDADGKELPGRRVEGEMGGPLEGDDRLEQEAVLAARLEKRRKRRAVRFGEMSAVVADCEEMLQAAGARPTPAREQVEAWLDAGVTSTGELIRLAEETSIKLRLVRTRRATRQQLMMSDIAREMIDPSEINEAWIIRECVRIVHDAKDLPGKDGLAARNSAVNTIAKVLGSFKSPQQARSALAQQVLGAGSGVPTLIDRLRVLESGGGTMVSAAQASARRRKRPIIDMQADLVEPD